jgi:hypothetical protein
MRRITWAIVALPLLAGCASRPTPAPTATPPPVFAAASPVSRQAPTATTRPQPLPATPTPTPRRDCLNGASFLEDLTIPDGSILLPGEAFEKRWSVRNSGSCDWGADYRLVPLGENRLGGPSEMALYPAKSGSTAVWAISLAAPRQPGEYLARWQAQGPDGKPFGDEVFVLVFVEEPTATPSPAPTATP